MTNQEFANGLRLIADFYEAQPEMEQFIVGVYTHGRDKFLKALRALSHGGKVTKDLSDTSQYAYVRAERMFGDLKLTLSVSKECICERIVTYKCPDSLLEEAMNAEEVEAQ
jgi:hypothetical protein